MNRRTFLKWAAASSLSPLWGMPAWASPSSGELALVIDDIGYSRHRAEAFLRLELPITFAILPRLPYTRQLARDISRQGHEVVVHQPMEPLRPDQDPGPGAIWVEDSPGRIARVLAANIEENPYAVGLNNHMGSRFTQDGQQTFRALEVVKRWGGYFLDSRTSWRSMAYQVARGMHMDALRRHFFIDLDPRPCAVAASLAQAARYARLTGQAIAIGHPHLETLEGIRRFSSARESRYVQWVYASRLLG